MKRLIFFSALFILFSVGAQAQEATPAANKRQRVQKVRIKDGVKDGELTKAETRQLVRQQKHIRRTKRRAKSDGEVTRAERRVIQKKQNRANRNIRRKKNNDIDRN